MICDGTSETLIIEILLDALKANKQHHIGMINLTMTLQIVAIGWFISVKDARTYLHEHKSVRLFGLACIMLLMFLHYAMLKSTFSLSSEISEEIQKICEGDSFKPFSFFVLEKSKVFFRALFTLILFLLLLYLVYGTGSRKIV